MSVRFLVGDVFDGLATIPDGSVDLVVTSPPFLALRSYLPADHPDKIKEIGSEATPAEFLDVLLRVTQESRRVLAPHGSICVELGDTYAGTGGAGGDWSDSEFTTKARVNGGSGGGPTRRTTRDGWPLAKSKTLIPELYRIALAYGINPLTGQESPAGRWRVRNVVTWCRPNPPVGALGDKWRPATSDVVVACVSDKRYWDDFATRKPHSPNTHRRNAAAVNVRPNETPSGQRDGNWNTLAITDDTNPAGAPLLDYWEIPPGGYKGSHYAVFPPELVVPLVKAMCPSRVCVLCGEPARRTWTDLPNAGDDALWTCCGCGDGCVVYDFPEPHGVCQDNHWRPGLVLDCFGGSGTTGAVATGHGHDAVLIDLDDRNAELARERIGPMLFDGPHHLKEARR